MPIFGNNDALIPPSNGGGGSTSVDDMGLIITDNGSYNLLTNTILGYETSVYVTGISIRLINMNKFPSVESYNTNIACLQSWRDLSASSIRYFIVNYNSDLLGSDYYAITNFNGFALPSNVLDIRVTNSTTFNDYLDINTDNYLQLAILHLSGNDLGQENVDAQLQSAYDLTQRVGYFGSLSQLFLDGGTNSEPSYPNGYDLVALLSAEGVNVSVNKPLIISAFSQSACSGSNQLCDITTTCLLRVNVVLEIYNSFTDTWENTYNYYGIPYITNGVNVISSISLPLGLTATNYTSSRLHDLATDEISVLLPITLFNCV
tara:strand:+ start:1424 stop:2377 length:954 start_codon:yes stop_codon:yes gene_type:complete